MWKVIGIVIIVMWILYTILPLHPHTENVFVEGPPNIIEYYTIEDSGEIITHRDELPNINVEERTYRTWFLLVLPLEILESPAYGIGRAVGYFGLLALGIWLVRRKKKLDEREGSSIK